MKIGGISLFPFVILRENLLLEEDYWRFKRRRVVNHETIHFEQALEMLVIPFYVWYVVEWTCKAIQGRFKKVTTYKTGETAYKRLSFEREAYLNEYNFNYRAERNPYGWIKYLLKK